MSQLLLFKNKPYDGVRLTIAATQSGVINYFYTEAIGERYYYTFINSTEPPSLEAATFKAFLSFTQSGISTHEFNIIPIQDGETCMLNIKAIALNASATKAYMMETYGGFRHDGSNIYMIGGTMSYNHRSDYTSAQLTTEVRKSGTQSIVLRCIFSTSDTVNWDIHLDYTKGFHSIIFGPGGDPSSRPIYPPPPPPID